MLPEQFVTGSYIMSPKDDDAVDQLVPDGTFTREIGVSRMTVSRRDHDAELAKAGFWPLRVMVNGRGFRFRKDIERFKAEVLRNAVADRRRMLSEKNSEEAAPV